MSRENKLKAKKKRKKEFLVAFYSCFNKFYSEYSVSTNSSFSSIKNWI